MQRRQFRLAAQKAEEFLRDRGITRLPIDPVEIAKALDIVVQPKPDTAEGVSGLLLWHDASFGILYATYIGSEGFQRFSISHELGHYLLEGHIDHLFPGGGGIHTSRAGFVSADTYELEADYFAAGLLMPGPLFSEEVGHYRDGLPAVKGLASKCRTSLTATAIRYVEKTSAPVAVVMSTGQRIDYCFMSQALQAIEGLERPRKGNRVPKDTETGDFSSSDDNIRSALERTSKIDLRVWFGGHQPLHGIEEVIGLGRYGKTLTVISLSRQRSR